MIKVCWLRHIYNAYEPDNFITFLALDTHEQYYQIYGLKGELWFRDGHNSIRIDKKEDGYHWQNDREQGISPTFEDAFSAMPSMITHPDHYVDDRVILNNFLD